MAKDPAFLFYSSDFLTGTQFFTHEQKGQYITLLCMQHQQGKIEEKHMLFICGTHDNDVCKKFEKREDGFYYNIRLENEVNKRAKYSESRRNNRIGTGSKDKPAKKSSVSKSYVPHMENEIVNEITLLFSTQFVSKWLEWKKYKWEQHKFKFKNIESETKSLKLLQSESHKNELEAAAMLAYAMAKGWKSWVPKDDVNFYSGNSAQSGKREMVY